MISITIDTEPDLHTNNYLGVTKGIPRILRILNKHKIKATLFTTCDCIEKYPKVFQKLKKEGHEISLHGYKHTRFDNLSLSEKQKQINKSVICFKKYLNLKPKGFRAPQHSIDFSTLRILEKNNFYYDSSIMPWNLYHLLFFWKIYINPSHHFLPSHPFKWKGMLELPITSIMLPFSSFALRILPKPLLKIYLNLISYLKISIFLSHSWDFIEIQNSKIYKICSLNKFLDRFEYMLDYFSRKEEFLTLDKITTNLNLNHMNGRKSRK